MTTASQPVSDGGSRLRRYPFDVLANKVPRHPEDGQVILTYYGALLRLPDGEIAFDIGPVFRHRLADGRPMPFRQFVNECLCLDGWDHQNLACFLEYVTEHLDEYEPFIQQAPEGYAPKIRRISIMAPGQPLTATGVPKNLRTPVDFPVPGSVIERCTQTSTSNSDTN